MATEKKTKFLVHILDDEARNKLRAFFDELEKELDREGMGTALFNVVQELVTNAVKANVKRIFFENYHYHLDNPVEYQRGLKDFRQFFRSLDADTYRKNLKEMDLSVRVDVDLDHKRLLIFVRNNTIMIQEEEARIRKNLAAAMGGSGLILTVDALRRGEAGGRPLAILGYSLGAGALMALGSMLGYLTVGRVGAAFLALAMAFPTLFTYVLSLVLGMDKLQPLRLLGVAAGMYILAAENTTSSALRSSTSFA